MKKTLFSLIILSLFVLFTGCGTTNETQETTADTILDDQIFSRATAINDLEECERIENKNKQKECQDVVQASLTTEQAIAEADASLCKKIKLARYKEECESQVSRKVAELEVIAERERQEEIRGQIAQEAYDTQNPKLCEEIKDINMRSSCEFNSVIGKVAENKDASLCQVISKEELRETCKGFASAD